MTTSDKAIALVGLYDIEWFINNKSVIIPENSAIAIHDNNSERDFFIFGDGKSAIGELELREIGLEPFPKHSLDFELIEQKNYILSSLKTIVSTTIDEEMKSLTDSDSEINPISNQYVQSLLHNIKRNILRGIDNI